MSQSVTSWSDEQRASLKVERSGPKTYSGAKASAIRTARKKGGETKGQGAKPTSLGAAVEGKTLMELSDTECRYPVGERFGQHVFCGAACGKNEPYCETHKKLCSDGKAPVRLRKSKRVNAPRFRSERCM